MLLPGPIAHTGVNIPHGQSAGWLGASCEPFHLSADPASPRFEPRRALDRARRHLEDARGPALADVAATLDSARTRTPSTSPPSGERSATPTGGPPSARAA